jgi:hypothetical protein
MPTIGESSRLHEDKSTLMNMAATWDSFAVTEQAHIDRQEGTSNDE